MGAFIAATLSAGGGALAAPAWSAPDLEACGLGADAPYWISAGTIHLLPGTRSLLPVVAYPGPEGNWIPAVALTVLALWINAGTRGSTAWARRLFAEA